MNITNRRTHNCQQGSPEWHALRADRYNASDASAMMGASLYATRAELIRRKATGITPEVDAATQRRFDDGHAIEAAALPIVESILQEELFPVVMTAEVDGLPLLASMDGLTMLGDVGWECKTLNRALYTALQAGSLDEHYRIQMEQQLLVSGASRIYFTASDGTKEGTAGMWYEGDAELRRRIVAGWRQFAADVAAYVPEPEQVKPAGKAPDALPALRIEVTGMVTASNLAAFREHALAVFGSINTNLQTDVDFADAEKTVKWCKDVEDRLDAAKQHALSQTASIDELFRTIDTIKAEARTKRLELDKLVKAEKDARRTEIVMRAQQQVLDAYAAHNLSGLLPAPSTIELGSAIKGLKSIDSMREKVEAAARELIYRMSQQAATITANRAIADMSLFPDFAHVCTKLPEDFAALQSHRKAQRDAAEAARIKAERERIRAEEEAKARREAERIAQAERDRIRAEEQARARAEAEAARIEQAERDRVQREAEAARRAEEARAAAEHAAQVAAERAKVERAKAEQPAPQPVESGAKLTLGQINARLAPIALSAAGLAQLGIQPAGKDRAAVLYFERDIPRICAALVVHLQNVARIKEAA